MPVVNQFRIQLDEEDLKFASQLEKHRFSSSRKRGVVDRANSVNPDRVGSLGEIAFGKLFNLRPVLSGVADKGIDYTINTFNVDVKALSKPNSRWLILTNQGPYRNGTVNDIHELTDVWVMMRPESINYDVWHAVGWCNREDALAAQPADLPSYTKPLGIHANALRPMEELMNLLKEVE